MGDLSILHSELIHPIIYLHQYGPLDVYFTLWLIIQYYIIYFVTLAIGSISCVPLTCPHPFDLRVFSLFCTIKCRPRLILYITCLSLKISHFPMEFWPLLLENGFRNHYLGTGCACCYCGIIDSGFAQ